MIFSYARRLSGVQADPQPFGLCFNIFYDMMIKWCYMMGLFFFLH